MNRLTAVAAGLVLIVGALGALVGLDSCRKHQGTAHEQQAAVHSGEAIAHAQAAQAIPDHAPEIKAANDRADAAEARVARERAKVARLESMLRPGDDTNGAVAPPADPVAADLLAAKDGLIRELDGQVVALKAQNGELSLAFADEQKRSAEWRATAEARERQALAQEAATKAWKDAVSTSRWRGRIEGFAAGVALGFVGGRR